MNQLRWWKQRYPKAVELLSAPFSARLPAAVEKYVSDLMGWVKTKNPGELEFHQAVQEVAESLTLVLDREPRYRKAKILERIIEPERILGAAAQCGAWAGHSPVSQRLPFVQ